MPCEPVTDSLTHAKRHPTSNIQSQMSNDRGTELKLADCMQVDLCQLATDLSLDVMEESGQHVSSQDIGEMRARPHKRPIPIGNVGLRRDLPIEDDSDLQPIIPGNPDNVGELQGLSEEDRVAKLFPNSFKVSGIKHICDNALHSILQNLPT